MARAAGESGEGVRVVAAGIDSLYLAHRLKIDWLLVGRLAAAQLAAGAARRAPIDPRTGEPLAVVDVPRIHLAGLDLDVRPYGSSSAPYLMHAEGWLQAAVQPEPQHGAPTLQTKLLAESLWREGASRLVGLTDAIALDVGSPDVDDEADGPAAPWRYVQRADWAVDFQGWVPRVADFELFCAKGGPTRELYPDDEPLDELLEAPRMWSRWRLTGFRFGRTSIVLRLYDKTAELAVSGKQWFRRVWERSPGYVEGEPVWRLEIQVPRSYLKTLRTEGGEPLETIEDVLVAGSSIWRTVLSRIRLTNGDNERLDRATTRAEWESLRDTIELDGCLDGGTVTKFEQDKITADELVPKIRGYAAKFGALTGRDKLDDVMVDLAQRVDDLCASREETFEALVEKKKAARLAAELAREAADARAVETRARRARAYPCIRWARRRRSAAQFELDLSPRAPRQLSFGGASSWAD